MVERQVLFADSVLFPLTRRTGHYCFYRSVILATLLRPQGLPLLVNFGGRNLTSARMKAHCWLTLDDRHFYERTDPEETNRYCHPMGTSADGSVCYWLGPTFDDSTLNEHTVAIVKHPDNNR